MGSLWTICSFIVKLLASYEMPFLAALGCLGLCHFEWLTYSLASGRVGVLGMLSCEKDSAFLPFVVLVKGAK
jgi:hypothetical protein